MMYRKALCIITAYFIFTNGFTQNQLQRDIYKEVNVASPNAASLGKYADIPVNNHTGIPQISIPIYQVGEGKLSVPVSLSYHASGLKVMEPASWVGAGWSLNAGGVITRTVQGAPDERMTSSSNAQQNFGYLSDKGYHHYLWYADPQNQANTPVYLKEVYAGAADAEPDLFFFNFMGYSGKFYIGDDGIPVILPEEDFKIAYNYTGSGSIKSFTITAADGVKYYFGETANPGDVDPVERSITATASGGPGINGGSIASWYLNKIESPDGVNQITFTYQAENYSYYTISMYPIDYFEGVKTGSEATKIAVQGVRLSQISFSNGSINFITGSDLRTDLNGPGTMFTDNANTEARRLKEVQINSNVNGGYCKKFVLTHDYFTDNSSPASALFGAAGLNTDRQRLRLLQVQEQSCDGTVSVPPHVFEYNTGLVPRRLSPAQDHWGFFNNATTNTNTLIPAYIENDFTEKPGADRNPGWPAMQNGTIKKITYPTGGYSEFEFEPHKTWVSYTNYVKTTVGQLSVGYDGSSNADTYVTFSNDQHEIILSNSACYGGGNDCNVMLRIYNSSNTEVFYMASLPNTTNTQYLTLPAGTYRVNLTRVNTSPYTGYGGSVTIKSLVLTPYETNELVGGLRVKTVKHFENAAATPIVTNYAYNYNSGNTNRSSGILYSRPVYVTNLKNTGNHYWYQFLFHDGARFYRDYPINNIGWPYFTTSPTALKSPAAILPMNTTQGNHIGYNEVKVSQTGNGYSIYRYYGSNYWDNNISDVAVRTIVRPPQTNYNAAEYPAAPLQFEYKRGNLSYEGHFSETNQLISEANYLIDYTVSPVTTPGIKVYSELRGSGNYFSVRTLYELQSSKKTRVEKIDRKYDPATGNYITTNTVTLFESPYHAQATTETTTNSYGIEIKSKTKYSPEYTVPGCTPTDCWSQYQAALANNTNAYNTEVTNCNGNPTCILIAKSNWDFNNMAARRAYGECRRTNITQYNNCFNTAKTNADNNLKPIYELQNQFRVVPIEVSLWKNNLLTSAAYTQYTIPAGTAIVHPSKIRKISIAVPSSAFVVSTVSGNTVLADSRYTDEAFFKYSNERPVEMTEKSGIVTAWLWGYNNTVPVAKVVGADYATVNSAYAAVGSNLSQLRTHSSLANALVTTYTYNPLVGVTSETDPNGKTIFYEYDAMNRLKNIKDYNGNIVQNFCYNYAGNPTPCNLAAGVFYNVAISQPFTKNNCPPGQISTPVTYVVPAGKYSASSQAAADQLAWDDLNLNGQAYANANGTCRVAFCTTANCSGIDKKCVNDLCETGVRMNIASYMGSTGDWICEYRYRWSDGSLSQVYFEYSSTPCIGGGGGFGF